MLRKKSTYWALGHTNAELQHLTPHAHGTITSLTFSPDGKRLAWLEQPEGEEGVDKDTVVTYDLSVKQGQHGTMTRWTDEWDRSPDGLSVSRSAES